MQPNQTPLTPLRPDVQQPVGATPNQYAFDPSMKSRSNTKLFTIVAITVLLLVGSGSVLAYYFSTKKDNSLAKKSPTTTTNVVEKSTCPLANELGIDKDVYAKFDKLSLSNTISPAAKNEKICNDSDLRGFVAEFPTKELQSKQLDKVSSEIVASFAGLGGGSDQVGPSASIEMGIRDTTRRVYFNSIRTQLEAYYQDNAKYPTFAQLSSDKWIATNIKDVGLEIFRAPGINSNSLINAKTPTKDQFGYVPLLVDGKTPCLSNSCQKYEMFYYSERDNNIETKSSLN
jgi:hypothetical protein